MKTVIGYSLVAYLAALLVFTFFASSFNTAPKFYLPTPVSLDFPLPPKFSAIENAKQKKQAFFEYFSPIVEEVNHNILRQRDVLLSIQDSYPANTQNERPFDLDAVEVIDTLAEQYGLKPKEDKAKLLEQLLKRVNIVPSSLALAQAANESGWGTSRFAVKGNNYFGMWCYTPGCGYVPKSRSANAKHEVREFSSPAESVKAYIHNINTHRAYSSLRTIRQQAVNSGVELNGVLLADGLLNYSERREEYVAEIKSMIRTNKLDKERLILTTD